MRDYTYNSIRDRAYSQLTTPSQAQIDAMKREADFVKSVKVKLGEKSPAFKRNAPPPMREDLL